MFFFKQGTAYEISACLVGSEMCIRGRKMLVLTWGSVARELLTLDGRLLFPLSLTLMWCCLLYISDAADEEDSVNLGGRRII